MESSQFKPQDFNSGHYTFEHIWDTAVISEFSDQINDLCKFLAKKIISELTDS